MMPHLAVEIRARRGDILWNPSTSPMVRLSGMPAGRSRTLALFASGRVFCLHGNGDPGQMAAYPWCANLRVISMVGFVPAGHVMDHHDPRIVAESPLDAPGYASIMSPSWPTELHGLD